MANVRTYNSNGITRTNTHRGNAVRKMCRVYHQEKKSGGNIQTAYKKWMETQPKGAISINRFMVLLRDFYPAYKNGFDEVFEFLNDSEATYVQGGLLVAGMMEIKKLANITGLKVQISR